MRIGLRGRRLGLLCRENSVGAVRGGHETAAQRALRTSAACCAALCEDHPDRCRGCGRGSVVVGTRSGCSGADRPVNTVVLVTGARDLRGPAHCYRPEPELGRPEPLPSARPWPRSRPPRRALGRGPAARGRLAATGCARSAGTPAPQVSRACPRARRHPPQTARPRRRRAGSGGHDDNT